MFNGQFPEDMLKSRTVFVPKKTGANEPGHFRPISVTSVVVRQIHKIFASRLRTSGLVDEKQRCLEDGCTENIAVLATLLDDSRRNLKELHITTLDVAKAFDSVSHHAIAEMLNQKGLPTAFKNYIMHTYRTSSTILECGGARSDEIKVQRGVKQGDPLSAIIFCLVIDTILAEIPPEVGYDISGRNINAFAYADDIILVTSTKHGMQVTIERVESKAEERGLMMNSSKCGALSIMPDGKRKTYKVMSQPQFKLRSGIIPQLKSSEEWRYLGIDIRPVGPKKTGHELAPLLENLSKAPLKPQQRLKILRCFLIPRLYHRLVLATTTMDKLKAMDKQIRSNIRRWLRLPEDVPTGFFHTVIADGGLGIPAFATTIPGLILSRFKNLPTSTSSAVRAVAEAHWVTQKLQWSQKVLRKDGTLLETKDLRRKWWTDCLYNSNDGIELRETSKTNLSTMWMESSVYAVPGREFIQNVHVRINCLPTRIRTSRGIRRTTSDIQCRGGCGVTETAAHVIQGCHRTHGGRIRRHNTVSKILVAGLRDKGFHVEEEPRFQTSAGLRKPDIVAIKNEIVNIIDSQVVSGATSINSAHERKKRYYADNEDLVREAAERYDARASNVKFSTCTISWRGVWASKSADYLKGLGLSKKLLAGITTRVLQGSSMNWNRWNKMTGVVRTGVG